jgi:23S rRNA U2552 (ribose-2'-O)-methylase RlmE/FtsJ
MLTSFLLRVDHLRSVELCASALQVACHLLASRCAGSEAEGAAVGTFVAKLWAGGEQQPLLADMRSRCNFPIP